MKKFVFALVLGLMGPAAIVSVSAQTTGQNGTGGGTEPVVNEILIKTSECLAQQGQQISVNQLHDQLDHGDLVVEQVDQDHFRVADGGGMFDILVTDIP